MDYKDIQNIARKTIESIKNQIEPGMNLIDIREMCEQRMLDLGADSFWYYDVGAFCFAGDETAMSISGKRYKTTRRVIQNNDIITIDLSPQCKGMWGDYARTVIIENGKVVLFKDDISNQEWKDGVLLEDKLHTELKRFVNTETTFEELYFHMNEFIINKGYINLDFSGNLGHSIVRKKEDRIYIENNNKVRLSDVNMFTFEPHIGKKESNYGYKKENIYCFKNMRLEEL